MSPPGKGDAWRDWSRGGNDDGTDDQDLQADIEAGVGDLVAGEGWQRWLAVAAKFPKYSFHNQLLILNQRPDAGVVMGYRAWQALGHQVRRGEQSISILAPCTYKAKTRVAETGPEGDRAGHDRPDIGNHEDERQRGSGRRILRGFRVAHVFDVAQTDGSRVQPPERPALLEGEVPAQRLELGRAGLPLQRPTGGAVGASLAPEA